MIVGSRNISDLEQKLFSATFINIIIVVIIETRSHTVAQTALELTHIPDQPQTYDNLTVSAF